MCCDPTSFNGNEIDGECPECGEPTVDGDAFEKCGYSPCQCDICGYSPCDESC